jgi:hypothetical protein
MHLAERHGERDRDAQEMRYVQWPAKQSIERLTAGILKHQRHAVVVMRERDGSHRPASVKFSLERIFVLQPLDRAERGFPRGNKQDRGQAVAGAPVESDVSFPQRRKYVAREIVHEAPCQEDCFGTLILVTFSLARQSKKQPPSDRQPLERPHDLSKTKFNGVGGPRIHIGFMRIRDLYA